MNTTFLITCALLLTAAAAFLTIPPLRAGLRRGGEYFVNAITSVNIFQDARTTYIADNAFTARYLIAKRGTDAAHIDICTAADIPLGVVPDMNPVAGDLTYPLPCQLLCGAGNETLRMVASAAIAIDALVVPDAGGKVKTWPGTTGTYYIIGRALSVAAANNDIIHVAPLFYKDRTP